MMAIRGLVKLRLMGVVPCPSASSNRACVILVFARIGPSIDFRARKVMERRLLAALNIAHSFVAMLAERRRELGILRAVGASRSDLLGVVLLQASFLGAAGGFFGVIAGWLVCTIADASAGVLLPDFPFKPKSFFELPWWLALAALFAAVLAACIGAAWPAIRTARLRVTDALAD